MTEREFNDRLLKIAELERGGIADRLIGAGVGAPAQALTTGIDSSLLSGLVGAGIGGVKGRGGAGIGAGALAGGKSGLKGGLKWGAILGALLGAARGGAKGIRGMAEDDGFKKAQAVEEGGGIDWARALEMLKKFAPALGMGAGGAAIGAGVGGLKDDMTAGQGALAGGLSGLGVGAGSQLLEDYDILDKIKGLFNKEASTLTPYEAGVLDMFKEAGLDKEAWGRTEPEADDHSRLVSYLTSVAPILGTSLLGAARGGEGGRIGGAAEGVVGGVGGGLLGAGAGLGAGLAASKIPKVIPAVIPILAALGYFTGAGEGVHRMTANKQASAYDQGFIEKCASLGLTEEEMVKMAGLIGKIQKMLAGTADDVAKAPGKVQKALAGTADDVAKASKKPSTLQKAIGGTETKPYVPPVFDKAPKKGLKTTGTKAAPTAAAPKKVAPAQPKKQVVTSGTGAVPTAGAKIKKVKTTAKPSAKDIAAAKGTRDMATANANATGSLNEKLRQALEENAALKGMVDTGDEAAKGLKGQVAGKNKSIDTLNDLVGARLKEVQGLTGQVDDLSGQLNTAKTRGRLGTALAGLGGLGLGGGGAALATD